MGKITELILHCSDSAFGDAAMIRQWHLERGWRDIGYQYVVLNGQYAKDRYNADYDGMVEIGRKYDGDGILQADECGAHALGHNATSIGVCLIGRGDHDFNELQLEALELLLLDLLKRYGLTPDAVKGHCETKKANGKTCPNTDMVTLRKNLWENYFWNDDEQ